MVRRPKASATQPKMSVPTHSPANSTNTKVPGPATFSGANRAKAPSDSGVNIPALARPGMM